MNPYVTPQVAQAVIADRLAAADAYRRAKAARDGRTSHKRRLSWPLPGRRYGQVELTWPDGVRSVVSPQEHPAAGQARGLAGTRR